MPRFSNMVCCSRCNSPVVVEYVESRGLNYAKGKVVIYWIFGRDKHAATSHGSFSKTHHGPYPRTSPDDFRRLTFVCISFYPFCKSFVGQPSVARVPFRGPFGGGQ